MADIDPDRYERMVRMTEARRTLKISPRLQELIYVAVDLQVAHLYPDGAEVHIVAAIDRGATVVEVVEAMEISAGLTYRSLSTSLAIVASTYGVTAADAATTDHQDLDLLRIWPDLGTAGERLLPEVLPSLIAYVSAPDREKTLSDEWRALITVAVLASPAISDDAAVGRATAWCRELGIEVEDVAQAIFCGSLIGTHSFTRGYPSLVAASRLDRDRYSLGIVD
ncbi:hypothetical protein [Aeromicrobium panaciterrae]|uniref:hypothetical protein n=1 Tax=Aeromicrobium panaciterrae TaxID=363861 RepID=UPI0031CFADA3